MVRFTYLETLSEPAESTLVALVLVHHAVPGEPARVRVFLAHAASEKAFAAVARRGPIMFTLKIFKF